MTTVQPPRSANRWIEPFTAKGRHVTLVPLERDHEPELVTAVRDGRLSDIWYAAVPSPEGMRQEIERRLGLAEEGTMVPFTVLGTDGQVLGMTTYMNVDRANRRLEIGYTWYRESVQRTPVNTEAKLMLLRYAFEEMDCIAVGFRTAFFNMPSRRAIERLGAKLDGIWRNHLILPDGTLRDTCYYSIINSEWPAVRRHLTWLLDRPGSAHA